VCLGAFCSSAALAAEVQKTELTSSGGHWAAAVHMEKTVTRLGAGFFSALLLIAFTSAGKAQSTDSGVELAFMPTTKTVTLLNDGGKYVAIDLKHIPQGGTCRMDKDATIFRVGPGASSGSVQVRYAAPQISSGGCPFLTVFELSDAEYAAARAAFVAKEDEAKRKVDALKKDLGEKWDEVTGKKQ
jgi:hypothetical protein